VKYFFDGNEIMKENITQKSAVVLLSGGLDSTTTLGYAIHEGFDCHTLTFVYGQRHRIEIEASKKVAASFGLEARHRIIQLDPQLFSSSSLTSGGEVPKNREMDVMANEIPSTYVPARNTVFLALALAYAENVDAYDLFIGVNAVDYSGYPDCRPEFIEAFERMANLGTKAGVSGQKITIHTPLLRLTKIEIIQLGRKLGVDYSQTWSCYNPQEDGLACGVCDSCRIRRDAFNAAGLTDPIPYHDQ
jgi:7-cyano-7-deazaguanine synthase